MSECEYCGNEIPTHEGRGRTRRYCDATCRQRARREGMKTPPAEMLMQPRWVRWKPVDRNGRTTKMPIQADGTAASSTDPATWTDWEIANRSKAGEGTGFVLGDGIACIDLDHCYDNRNHLADWARRFLALAGDTFIEISPSGDGLHIWGTCQPRKGMKVRNGDMNIEAYSRGRYITVTGRPYKTSTRQLADITMLFDLTETLSRRAGA